MLIGASLGATTTFLLYGARPALVTATADVDRCVSSTVFIFLRDVFSFGVNVDNNLVVIIVGIMWYSESARGGTDTGCMGVLSACPHRLGILIARIGRGSIYPPSR